LRFAIGVGARSGVAAEEIVDIVEKVLESYELRRLPSPACGRRWPRAAGSDEGPRSVQGIEHLRVDGFDPSAADPHPTPLRGATFSHAWEKKSRVEVSLFSIESKRDERGLVEAARILDMTIAFLPLAALILRKRELLTHSPRVEALTGLGSVAEAAALVGAGPASALLGPRIANARATCAVARNALEQAP
jgi:cobalt-precorrin 5A hydrolase